MLRREISERDRVRYNVDIGPVSPDWRCVRETLSETGEGILRSLGA